MDLTVTLCDKDGNSIDIPKCSCGDKADTFMQGKEACIWYCNKCLYPDFPEAKFTIREWGGNMDVMHEGKRRKAAELLSETFTRNVQ